MPAPRHVLAIMQNMWVRDPARLKEAIARAPDPEAHRLAMIERLLFYRCISGRRIKAAFGPLTERIVWEETTREIAGNPKTIFPADRVHLQQAILKHRPKAIVTFGGIAGDALRPIWLGLWHKAPHPAARQSDVPARLTAAAEWARELYRRWDSEKERGAE